MNVVFAGLPWDGKTNTIYLNPRLPAPEAARLRQAWAAASMPGHVAVATSGTSGGPGKLVALSRAAIEASARAVNRALASDARDVWFKTLPDFHVGGLGMRARAALSGARLVDSAADKWDAPAFAQALDSAGATLVSLVPTQVFDLVARGLRAPPRLRAALVGGGAMDPIAFASARRLGWPILPSYGLSEGASTVAAASLASLERETWPELELLQHVEADVDAGGRLRLKSPSLLSAYVTVDPVGAYDPKKNDWFATEDRAAVVGGSLLPLGRADDAIKIGGELTSFSRLEAALAAARLGFEADVALVALEDDRLGSCVHLVYARKDRAVADKIKSIYDASVLPFERARGAWECERVPRSALGKTLRKEAQEIARKGVRSRSRN